MRQTTWFILTAINFLDHTSPNEYFKKDLIHLLVRDLHASVSGEQPKISGLTLM